LLRSAEAESGNHNFSVVRHGLFDDFQQSELEILRWRMDRVGIGRFGDQDIATLDRYRITQQRQAPAAQVACENDATRFPLVFDVDLAHG
jgi:hypothetical protein